MRPGMGYELIVVRFAISNDRYDHSIFTSSQGLQLYLQSLIIMLVSCPRRRIEVTSIKEITSQYLSILLGYFNKYTLR